MLSIQISSNAQAILAGMRRMPAMMAANLAAALNEQNEATVADVITNRMNFSSNGPVITGSLRRQTGFAVKSVRVVPAEIMGNGVTSSFGSNLRYLKAHEYGFVGTVNVRAHLRRRFIHGTATKNVFDFITREVVRKKVATRRVDKDAREIFVRAHSMKMNLPARHMFGETLAKHSPQYSKAINAAILKGWNGGAPSTQATPRGRGGIAP